MYILYIFLQITTVMSKVNIHKIFLHYSTLLNCTSIEDVRIDKCVNYCSTVSILCKNLYYRMN